MINLKSSSWNPKRLCTQIDKGNASFDNEIQRAAVWNASQKSLLIHSMIIGYPIPSLYAIQNEKIIDFLDGKQRSLAIYDFRNNKLALRELPEITTEDGKVDITGMKYKDLPEELKDAFDNYSLNITIMDNISREESEEIFYRLNNGTSLRTTDKNFAKALSKKAIIELCDHVIFERGLTKNAREKFAQRPIVIQSLMILNNQTNLGARPTTTYLTTHEITPDEHEQLSSLYDRLDTIAATIASDENIATTQRKKTIKHLLSRTNLPSVLPLMASTEDDDKLQKFFAKFFGSESKSSINEAYNEACGAGSTHTANVQLRLDILEKEFKKM